MRTIVEKYVCRQERKGSLGNMLKIFPCLLRKSTFRVVPGLIQADHQCHPRSTSLCLPCLLCRMLAAVLRLVKWRTLSLIQNSECSKVNLPLRSREHFQQMSRYPCSSTLIFSCISGIAFYLPTSFLAFLNQVATQQLKRSLSRMMTKQHCFPPSEILSPSIASKALHGVGPAAASPSFLLLFSCLLLPTTLPAALYLCQAHSYLGAFVPAYFLLDTISHSQRFPGSFSLSSGLYYNINSRKASPDFFI